MGKKKFICEKCKGVATHCCHCLRNFKKEQLVFCIESATGISHYCSPICSVFGESKATQSRLTNSEEHKEALG